MRHSRNKQSFLRLYLANSTSSFCTAAQYDSGGKTYALLGLFILLSKIYAGSRWAVVRKDLPTIKKNTYPSWDKIKPVNFMEKHDREQHTVTFKNGSQIIFFPESYETDKELNRWRGLEVNGFGFEEINECQYQSLEKAFERAGSYIIKNAKRQPPPIIVGTCNPTQGWVKDKVYKPFKDGLLKKSWHYIQSRIYDNKPLLEESPMYIESLKNNLSKYAYEVFVNGNWDIQLKTGGEFFKSFELEHHVKPCRWDVSNTLHISIDNNVHPYIAITIWQLVKGDNGWIARQVHELPIKDPNNTAGGAGRTLVNWLNEIDYKQQLFIYGDPTTKQRNTIDESKKSFLDLFLDPIRKGGFSVEQRFFHKAPPVALTGEFINACYDDRVQGVAIEISEQCTTSINDYIETKQDIDGGVSKKRVTNPATGVSYEPNGHLSDTKRYFLCKVFQDAMNTYKRGVSGYADLIENQNLNKLGNSLLGGI